MKATCTIQDVLDDATAVEYLRDVSARMQSAYLENCVVHACRVAELLLKAGHSPWIGSIRDLVVDGSRRVHRPLTPVRFLGRAGPTWTTHVVCCHGKQAYDPIVGEPISVDELAAKVFGRPLSVRKAVSEPTVLELSKLGTLNSRTITGLLAVVDERAQSGRMTER